MMFATLKKQRKFSVTLLPAMLAVVVGPVVLYGLASLAVGAMDDAAAGTAVCFDPAALDTPISASEANSKGTISPFRAIGAVAMVSTAVFAFFVVPLTLGALLFSRFASTRLTAAAWSLAGNSATLIAICAILRETVGIDRATLVVGLSAHNGLLFILAWQPGETWRTLRDWWQCYATVFLAASIAMMACLVVFFPEQCLQCFNEDGVETYELARSLRDHILPYWELETWDSAGNLRMGTAVVNPSLINSYWTFSFQVLLGGKELPTRLSYWPWSVAMVLVMYRLTQPTNRQAPSETGQNAKRLSEASAFILALYLVLATLMYTFYVGYNQYMADLANPGVPDTLFTLAVLLAFDCLRHRDRWGFILSMVVASLVLHAGPVMLVVTLVAAWFWQPIARRDTLGWAWRAIAVLTGLAVLYVAWGWVEGSLDAWAEMADMEYVNDYLAAAPRWRSGPVFFLYFLLGCGVVPILGFLAAFGGTPWQRTVATATLLYLLIVLCSGFKNLHYLGPLWPMPIVLFLAATRSTWTSLAGSSMASSGATSKNMRLAGGDCSEPPRQPEPIGRYGLLRPPIGDGIQIVAIGAMLLCIFVCWPKRRETFTLNRDFGRRTTMTTDSYATALAWARIRLELIEQGKPSWYFAAHPWVTYAQLDISPTADSSQAGFMFFLTDGRPPTTAFLAMASLPVGPEHEHREITLYARDEEAVGWLATRPILSPLARYPLVMRPLADGPYSPHNNLLEDVRRLYWQSGAPP